MSPIDELEQFLARGQRAQKAVDRLTEPTLVAGFALVGYSNGRVHCMCRYGACSFSHWFDGRAASPPEAPPEVLELLERHQRTHRPPAKRKAGKR